MADSIVKLMKNTASNYGWTCYEITNEDKGINQMTLIYNEANCSAHPERVIRLDLVGDNDKQRAEGLCKGLKEYVEKIDVSSLAYQGLNSAGHDKANEAFTIVDVIEAVTVFAARVKNLYKTFVDVARAEPPTSFIDDKEKMADFFYLGEDDFMESYSYLRQEEYLATYREVRKKITDAAEQELENFKKYASSGTAAEALEFAYELAMKQEYMNILRNRDLEAYVYGYLYCTDTPLDRMYQDWLASDIDIQTDMCDAVREGIVHG